MTSGSVRRIVDRMLVTLLLVAVCGPSSSGQEVEPWRAGFESITADELLTHLWTLAHDSMRGRDTPSPELDKAADYIAGYFRQAGLLPGMDSTYFQMFAVSKTRLGKSNALVFSTSSGSWQCKIKYDFVPLPISASGTVEAPIVFVGYGISAPEYGYDDYEGIDVRGKVVLMFTHEPRERDSTDVFYGPKATDHSKPLVKMLNAIDHGAVGMILVNDPLNHVARRPPNVWPSLMRKPPKGGVPLRLAESEEEIPAVQIGKAVAESLFALVGLTPTEVQRQIDSTLRPMAVELPVKAKIVVELNEERAYVKNVVAVLPGSDPALSGQVVVFGAHYDHVGTRNDTIVYNGSDDNASGTSGLLEIAEGFAENPVRPARTLLFIAFAGEEKGLFGSRYYSSHPIFPLDSTVAMINLDMISRNDTNQVGVAGSTVSPELFALLEKANEQVGMEITTEADRYFRQSDHYSFYRKGVPVLFFNTLDHEDLHKPSDDPDKAIPEKMEKIARLAYLTGWYVANTAERPSYHEFRPPKEVARTRPDSTSHTSER